jgi:signal transduction histidine kinase
MTQRVASADRRPLLWIIDPRRSLATGAVWLIIALAITFSITAAIWVGAIARKNLLEQHIRRLSLETDQLSSDVGQAIDARLTAVRSAAHILREPGASGRSRDLKDVFTELSTTYPQLDWIAVADSQGTVVDAAAALQNRRTVNATPWFRGGLKGPWLGTIDSVSHPSASTASELGDLATPLRDGTGSVVGVAVAHLSWRRSADHPQRLTDETDQEIATQAFVLDRNRVVLVGPPEFQGKLWSGVSVDSPGRIGRATKSSAAKARVPQFEQLATGRQVLVARSALNTSNEVSETGWQVQLCDPDERVYRRADAVAIRIFWISLGLGILTALVGIVGVRHLTRRLTRLALSVSQVGRDDTDIEVPDGVDEVAQLGRAFARILADLRVERRELERRVAVRTREVERLAEESRYAAVVRERLKIARDLHDTLAHSMMAILSEIRLLRRLHARDPSALAAELERAEAVAHEGLAEARSAISQMRLSAVRETGLGSALASAFEKFIDRTGLTGDFSAEEDAARFGDERGEALLRIALEALRNIEKHALATRVNLRIVIANGDQLQLLIEDDGVGFDPAAVLPDHFGIVGIREQAELIGAEVRIESVRNRGTMLLVSLPLSPVAFVKSQ